MESYIILGIELYADTLRYAKIEKQGDAWQLIRLGSYVFDFDVADVALNVNPPDLNAGQSVRSALQDILENHPVNELRVVLHPTQAHHFYVPVDATLPSIERAQTFLKDARTVTGEMNEPLHIVPHSLFIEELLNEETVAWYQVSVVKKEIFRQFAQFTDGFPIEHYQFCSAETSVAKIVCEMVQKLPIKHNAPFILVLGFYNDHTEFLLCRQQNLHFSTYAPITDPQACADHAITLIEKMHFIPQMVGQVYVYGSQLPTDLQPIQGALGIVPEVLHPVEMLKLDMNVWEQNQTLNMYLPAIGAAL
jgi:hypothetical protein